MDERGAGSKGRLWAGRTISGLVVLFLVFDGAVKVLQLPMAVEATTRLGYLESVLLGLGIVELACTLLFVVPATSIFGALLLTAYLGGATATHVRTGTPFFFPMLIGVLVWAGLYLREQRLRALIPIRK